MNQKKKQLKNNSVSKEVKLHFEEQALCQSQGLGENRILPACFKQAQSCKKSYLLFVDCLLKYFL